MLNLVQKCRRELNSVDRSFGTDYAIRNVHRWLWSVLVESGDTLKGRGTASERKGHRIPSPHFFRNQPHNGEPVEHSDNKTG